MEDVSCDMTPGRFLVVLIATACISIPLFFAMTGCAHDWGIYGGVGKSLETHSEWERPSDTYGTFGIDGNWLIHRRDNVYFNLDAAHRSQFDRDSPGDNAIELKLYKRFN